MLFRSIQNAKHIFRTAVNDSLSDTPKDNKFRKITSPQGLIKVILNREEVLFASSYIKEIDGKRKLVHEPLLPNIIFAYMTREKTYEFIKEPAITAKWLKYYTDKTKPTEPETGKNPPVIIPYNEMINFIKLTSVNSEHIMVLPPERCHFKKDELVRIIDGPFVGVMGKVGRASGQQRVFVELQGFNSIVATAYIPNDFIQKLPT